MSLKKISIIILINASVLCVLILLQFLMFAFLPGINPAIPADFRRDYATKFAIKKSVTIGIEAIVGFVVLFLLNTRFVSKKKSLIILILDFIIITISFLMFAYDYITENG